MANKDYESRMQGMIYALNIAKNDGIEALESDIRKRGITKAPLKFKQKEIDDFINYVSKNLYSNMLSVFCYALHEHFGFGGERLNKLKNLVAKAVTDTMNLDYLGSHYIRLEDYAVELNEKYNLGIDVNVIASCQSIADEKDDGTYHYAKIERIVEELKENGMEDAARFLESKIDD